MRVRPHRIFERDADDLYCEVPIPFTMAAMGGELDIPTLDGQVKLKVPQETQTGRMFRLKGKGMNVLRAQGRGDHDGEAPCPVQWARKSSVARSASCMLMSLCRTRCHSPEAL